MDTIKVPEGYLETLDLHRGGFNFDNCPRNLRFIEKGLVKQTQAKKTGTTICGILLGDCVVLAADTRATAGDIVADKNCEKLHPLADNIFCAGAGTSADLTHTTEMIQSQLALLRRQTRTDSRVCTAVQKLSSYLFQYQGYVGCALVLGGVDVTGPSLYQIYPHGSTDCLPFTTMGSGSLFAMSVLESRYRSNLSVEEGKNLVADAIEAGIFNDLGSGGQVDVCVVRKDGTEMFRNWRKPNPRLYAAPLRSFPKGTTRVLKEDIRELVSVTDG